MNIKKFLESSREALETLCQEYRVARLEIFGSAVAGGFSPETSDLDFLVEFLPDQDLGPWLAHYFAFRDELVRLFGRPVDLVMPAAMKNPYFIREVARTRKLLYAA